MGTLRAYHGDEAVKAKYLARVRAHRAADELVQGIGWSTEGKGCAVGCTLDAYDHERYPVELGLPLELAYLEDRIFEMLLREEAMAWPEAFLDAIQPGANTHRAYHRAMARILREVALAAVTRDEWGVREAVEAVAGLHEGAGRGQLCRVEAARAAGAAGAARAAGAAEAAWAAEAAGATRAAEAAWAAGAARAAEAAGAAKQIRDIVLDELQRAEAV